MLGIFNKAKKVHFIGIGGIGISAIARLLLFEGKVVTGSDRTSSLITDELVKAGAKIEIGHSATNIKDPDLVIYTIAIPKDNLEFLKANELDIPMLSYPEALGVISKDKFTIAISGTHGKTTTTAMIGKIMIDAMLDPTVIVGSLMNDSKSNLIVGKSNFLVVESCEYRRSFLNIHPKIIVITNIDNDHLDYYRDLPDIQSAFSEFVEKLGPKDYLIAGLNDRNLKPIMGTAKCQVVDYGQLGSVASKLRLRIPGKHNVENAKAALALTSVLGIDKDRAIESLNSFFGTWRRFEYKGKTSAGAYVYDDYGHHPTEIRATLLGAREYFGKDKKIVVIFQPHLYSRTKILLNDFAMSFNNADELIILPIYAAREVEDPTISSDILAKAIIAQFGNRRGVKAQHPEKVTVVGSKDEVASFIPRSAEVIITIGAGDVTDVSDMLIPSTGLTKS